MVARQPVLGAVARDLLVKPGALLVGTIRRDGSARISGTEPLLMDGELWLAMMVTSAKVKDLRRDPRILLHSVIPGPQGGPEVKLRGTARAESDPAVQQRFAAAAAAELGWEPVVGEFALFAVDIDDISYVSYDPVDASQHVARWPAGVEYVRSSTTATSLGPPQPVRRLLG